MKKILLMLMLLSAALNAGATTITQLQLVAQTGSSATITWTTDVASSTQLFYGVGQQFNSTPINHTLVTSHSVTITGVMNATTYSYYAVSTDVGNNTATSPIQQFTVCTSGTGLTNVQGTVNNYYEYGQYIFNWVPPSGFGGTPTVCGQPLTESYSGTLDQGASLSQQIPNTNIIVPSPSQWQLTVAGVNGIIGSFNITQQITPQGNNLTVPLQLAAQGNLLHCWYDPTTSTSYPSQCGNGGGGGTIGGTITPYHVPFASANETLSDSTATWDSTGSETYTLAASLGVVVNSPIVTYTGTGSQGGTLGLLAGSAPPTTTGQPCATEDCLYADTFLGLTSMTNMTIEGNTTLTNSCAATSGGNCSSYSAILMGSGWNAGLKLTVTSSGTGYTPGQIYTCTLTGGTYSTGPADCAAVGGAGGGLNVIIADPGVYSVAPSIAISGSPGSGWAGTLSITPAAASSNWSIASYFGASGNAATASPKLIFAAPGRNATSGNPQISFLQQPLQGTSSELILNLPPVDVTGSSQTIEDYSLVTLTNSVFQHPNVPNTSTYTMFTGSPVAGNCPVWVVTSSVRTLGDNGAPCPTSGFPTGGTVNALVKFATSSTGTSSQVIDDGTNPPNSNHGFDVGLAAAYDVQLPNNTSTGTVLNKSVCDDGTGKGIVCPHASSTTNQVLGFAQSGAGTTGNVRTSTLGWPQVLFDNTSVEGHYAINSTTVDGELHDTGSATLTAGQPNFFVYSANSGAGTVGAIRLLIADDFNNSSPTAVTFATISTGTNTAATMTCGTGCSVLASGTGSINATKIGGISVTGTPAIGYAPIATSTTTATWQALPSGMVYPGAGIPLSTGSAWLTSYSAQGTDTKLLTAGTVSGTGASLCTDSSGGATTSGCASGGGFPTGASQFGVNTNANIAAVTPNMTYDQQNQLTNVGLPLTTQKGFLVLASFGGETGSISQGSGQSQELYISISSNTDKATWNVVSSGFAPTTYGLRDPSITKIGQTYWLAYTIPDANPFVSPGACSVGFGVAYSQDLVHWTNQGTVTITGGSYATTCTAAPEWFIDNPGCTTNAGTDNLGYSCTAAQGIHIFYADNTAGSSSTPLNIYHVKAITLTPGSMSWGNEAGTANQSDLVLTNNGTEVYDPYVIRYSSGQWRMLFANAANGVQYATASSIAGTYTQVSSGNWTGNFGSFYAEAPSMWIAGQDSSGNTIWDLAVDTATTGSPVGTGIQYIESHDNWTTWQSVGTSGTDYLVPFFPKSANSSIGVFHHGTVARFMDIDTTRDVAQSALYAQLQAPVGTANYIPVFGSSTTITGNSHIDDGVTTSGFLTSSEPFNINVNTSAGTGTGVEYNNAAGSFINAKTYKFPSLTSSQNGCGINIQGPGTGTNSGFSFCYTYSGSSGSSSNAFGVFAFGQANPSVSFDAIGDAAITGHLNQHASGNYGGTCSMSTGTTCTFSISAAYNSTPICVASPQSSTYTSGMAYCAVSGTTVTVTAPVANSLTWGAILLGNPN